MANRGNGPDHVMQIAYERAPKGFKHINDVIPQEELEGIGAGYKAIAGFEVEKVNQGAAATEGTAERLGLQSPKVWTRVLGERNGVDGTNGHHHGDGAKAAPAETAIGLNGSVMADP
jgi:hypothetical protein